MKAERWKQVDCLLDEALALPPGERDAFLMRATDGDEELRREVMSLLNAHDRAEGDFLGAPALEMAARGLAARQEYSLIGKRFGSYQILSVLGVGGMGEVYLARDERLGRQLALKILPPQFVEDATLVERFAREAYAVSALNHPNIVTVYDIGQLDGTHFIAMEYVNGHTLREKTLAASDGREGTLDAKEVVEIALQISAALAAAHEAGIIHRDIKPENLMLRRDDYVKVLDFGLVKLTEKHRPLGQTLGDAYDPAATNPGTVLGTVRYMSPEQAMGREVDEGSDIFSLGVVLYELLTGSPPFKGDRPAAILDAVVHHAPLPLTQLRPDLSGEFERIIGKMLEKDRQQRYQSAEDLRAAFKQLKRELDSSPAHSLSRGSLSDNGTAKPTVRFRARRLVTAIAAAIVLAVIGFAAWWLWPDGIKESSPWLSAYSSHLTNFPGEERNPSLSPDGKSVYYARPIQGQWDIFWQRVGGSKPTNLTEDSDEDDTQPACSPDGASLVFRSERKGGGLFVMGATGENVRQISRFGQNPSWSPDGQYIVCGTDYILDPKRRVAKSRLLVIPVASGVASGKERVLLEGNDAAQPRWSPGGQRIAYYFRTGGNRRDIWTIAADGSDPRPVTDDDAVDWNPVWSSDGKYLYFASDRKAVASLWRVPIDEATGRTLGKPEPVTGPTAEILQMDMARDGRRIVYANRIQDANLKSIGFDPVRLVTTGEAIAITEGTRPSGSPNVSPDGQLVAFHTLGAAQEDIWLVRSDGSGAQTNLTNDEPLDRSPRWSPDGKRLAFFSIRTKTSQIWLINPDGSGKTQLTFTKTDCSFPFWSPDGGRIAYQLSNTGVTGNSLRGTQIIEADKPWDQQTPVTLPALNDAGDWFNGYTWSPDSKYLAGYAATLQGKEVRGKDGIFLYSFETNRYEQITEIGSRPEWLSDSRHVIFTHRGKGKTAEHQVWVVDIRTKIPKPIISHPTYLISTLGVTRDSRRIFFTATAHQADIFLLSLDK